MSQIVKFLFYFIEDMLNFKIMWSVFLETGQFWVNLIQIKKITKKTPFFRIFSDIKHYNLDNIRPASMKFGHNNLKTCRFLPTQFEPNSSLLTTIYKNCNSYKPVMKLLREYFPLILHNCYITLIIIIINPLTTPVLLTHQNPHKPNTTYKYILLERRLSSLMKSLV